jgi:hypothetical protein
MVDRQGYDMTDDADRALRGYIEARVRRPRFAHGRSIRNAIERARLRQATRLFESHRKLTRRDLVTIEADDILQSSVFDDTGEETDGESAREGEAEASVGT